MGWSLDFLLQCLQMALFVATFLCGILSCMAMGWTTRILGGQCPLYGSTDFSLAPDCPTCNLSLDTGSSNLGDPHTCDYVTYTCAFAAIYAVIWFWFYILVSDWKYHNLKQLITDAADEGPPADMRLFGPSIITNVLLLAFLLASAGIASAGRAHWCRQVEKKLEAIFMKSMKCSFLDGHPWTNLPNGENIYQYLMTSMVVSWILVALLVTKVVLVVFRLYRYSKLTNRDWTFWISQPSDINLMDKDDPENSLAFDGLGQEEEEVEEDEDEEVRDYDGEEFGEMKFLKGRIPSVSPSEPKEAESLLHSPKRTENDQCENDFSSIPIQPH